MVIPSVEEPGGGEGKDSEAGTRQERGSVSTSVHVCRVQMAWISPTLSAAKGKRLLGYFPHPLRTALSPVQTCLKPQSQ